MAEDRQPTPVRASYRLLMELGRGGMGVVNLAMSRSPQGVVKLVVLKTLHPDLLGSAMARRMFLEEARISVRLAHPNIVQVYEVIEFEGVPTIVMEYLDGQPLSKLLGDDPGSLPPPLHVHVLTQLLAGLHAAHSLRDYDGTALNLIHRDISPHNVFVLFDGHVKVLDFGIAKAERSEVETQTGELKGKIRYMAPEQLRGDPLDRRVDVFAVGVMLWEALAGQRLWANMTDGDVMLRLLNHQIPALPADRGISPELARICMCALEPDRERRYATAKEFAVELEAASTTVGPPVGASHVAAFLEGRFGEARAITQRTISNRIADAERASAAEEAASREEVTAPGKVVTVPGPRGARPVWIAAASFGVIVFAVGAFVAARMTSSRNAVASTGTRAAVGSASPVCGAGFKSCGGECVSIDRPDVGCGSDDCVPCYVPNATARCNSRHVCDIAVCYKNFESCDSDPANGCETDLLTDPDHCGSCAKKCPPLPHAKTGCGDTCTVWRCDDGYRDCNERASDGCEVHVTDDRRNCGHCGVVCPSGKRCVDGTCTP